jgi:cell fate (sporulation/competence/biofilm development) regulator YlbF (YheA/YmcA/DUF963 family)
MTKTLFDQIIQNENVKKMFDQLPDDSKYQIQEAMKTFMNDLETKIINPIKQQVENTPK